MTPENFFTAAQVAGVLGLTSRAVRKRLGSAGPWRVDDLPQDYRESLKSLVPAQGCRDIPHLLSSASFAWQPEIPWAELEESTRVLAIRRQRVFQPWLQNRHTLATHLSVAEIEARGVADYVREFGQPISTRHWRHIFKRTLQRDGNREEWSRPELYLDEALRPASCLPAQTPKPGPLPRSAEEFSALLSGVASLDNPTAIERDEVWRRAAEFMAACPLDSSRARIKRAMLEWLLAQMPRLARNFNSARAILDARSKALSAGEIVGDRRCRHNKPAPAPDEEQKKQALLLSSYAGEAYDGKLAPARRDLVELGLLPASSSRSKSYVNAAERDLARQPARIGAIFKRGRRAVKSITPDIMRDPNKMFCNDAFTGDDFTMPVLMWWNGADGRPQIGPGQCLILSDFRSWFVVNFSLQPEPNYNSHVVRTLIMKGFREHGLAKVLYFERGKIWETSKMLKGDDEKDNEWKEAHSEAEITYGLESQLGVKFIHAQSPQAKSQIEHLGAILQDMMMGEPGYTGRDQRKDLPDAVRRQIAEVKAGQAHPSKYFYHIDQWRARLRELIEKYNHTKQEGRWLNHLSPAEAFVRFQNPEDPPTKFDENCAFWLSHQVSRRRVNPKGMIKFRFDDQPYQYWNEHTVVHLAGRWVLCFLNPEAPDSLVITDLQRRNPVLVPRVGMTAPIDPEDPATRSVMGLQKRCVAALRAQYEVMRSPENRIFRQPLVAPDVQHLGGEIERQTNARQAKDKQAGRAQQVARTMGLKISEEAAARPESIEELRRLKDFLSDEEEASAPAPAAKTYVLNQPPLVALPTLRKQLFALWHRVETLRPDLSRHSITNKALGHNKAVPDMTREEIARCMEVFSAILREAKEKENP